MNILAIGRSRQFSPNSANRDSQTFNMLIDKLKRDGHKVVTLGEGDIDNSIYDYKVNVVISMGRSANTLRFLSRLEQNGLVVYNSPSALLNLTREYINGLCKDLNISIPSTAYSLKDISLLNLNYPCWLKRDDACSQTKEDVSFVDDINQLETKVKDFCKRDIKNWTVSEHISGDLIKFYGVEGTDFFYAFSPKSDGDFSKFGLEVHNDGYQGYEFDIVDLKRKMDCLSKLLGIPFYGGDVIVQKGGNFVLIDFNDWPSFSNCRNLATNAMVMRIEGVKY